MRPASRRRWPFSGSAQDRRTPPRSWTRRSSRWTAARPTSCTCRPTFPPNSSGRWCSTTRRRARCCRPISSSPVSAARRKAWRSTPTRRGCLLRADGAVRQGGQLGADLARQGVDRHSSSLRSAAAILRQDVATQRDRGGRLTDIVQLPARRTSALFREGRPDAQRHRLRVRQRNVGHHGDDEPAFGETHEAGRGTDEILLGPGLRPCATGTGAEAPVSPFCVDARPW